MRYLLIMVLCGLCVPAEAGIFRRRVPYQPPTAKATQAAPVAKVEAKSTPLPAPKVTPKVTPLPQPQEPQKAILAEPKMQPVNQQEAPAERRISDEELDILIPTDGMRRPSEILKNR